MVRIPKNSLSIYFVTLTVVDWVDVFTRPINKITIVDSLKYCQKSKGLKIYSWCLMTNHLHMIIGSTNISLSDILRDFKKFTSKKVVENILNYPESRKDWILYRFAYAAKYNPKIKNYKFWQDGNKTKEIISENFLLQKIEYIHFNPVKAKIVEKPEEYLFSSAKNYVGRKGLIDIDFIE